MQSMQCVYSSIACGLHSYMNQAVECNTVYIISASFTMNDKQEYASDKILAWAWYNDTLHGRSESSGLNVVE